MDSEESMDDFEEAVRNHVEVSFKLANHVFSTVTRSESNLVFSPLSIHVILSLIAAGSKGPTLHELLAFLKSNSAEDLNTFYSEVVSAVFADGTHVGGPRLSVANGAWFEQTLPPLKASFKHVVETVYQAEHESVDFRNRAIEVVKHVNLWVEKETGGLIKHILHANAANAETRFILANALYFKGEWYEKFDASLTEENGFHLLNGTSVRVPFMSSGKRQYVKAFDGFKVLTLHYKQGDDHDDDDDDDYDYDKRSFSMSIFLPDARDGLPSLLHKVADESRLLEEWLPYYTVEVGDFRIPKFKFSFGFEASKALKGLGVVSPFEGEGLTEMVEGSEVYVSEIIHKSFIEVNEGGTEAGAATVTYRIGCCWRPEEEEEVDFVADHPFLYFIREGSTGAVLLVGTVINPL